MAAAVLSSIEALGPPDSRRPHRRGRPTQASAPDLHEDPMKPSAPANDTADDDAPPEVLTVAELAALLRMNERSSSGTRTSR
jgi:hypothetical protein